MTHEASTFAGIAAALAADRVDARYGEASIQVRSAWRDDYGPERRTPDVGSARLADGGGWNIDGGRGPIREGRLVDRDRRSRPSLWRKVTAGLCPGTMVFVVCVGIVTFIAVV